MNKELLISLTIAGLLYSSHLSSASITASEEWQRIDGKAIDIGIGSSGVVHIVDNRNLIWRWIADKNRWKKLPGKFTRVDTDNKGIPWAITVDGELRRYQKSYWQLVARNAFDIGIGDSHVFVTLNTQTIGEWDEDAKRFQTIEGKGRYIDVDYAGQPWVITKENKVIFRKNGQWQTTDLVANDIGLGKNSLFISEQGYESDPSGTKSISIGPDDIPWLVTNKGEIYVKLQVEQNQAEQKGIAKQEGNQDTEQDPKGSAEPLPTSRDPLNFIRVNGIARDVAVGADGSVFIVEAEGDISRYSDNQNQFLPFPGSFNRIASAPDGTLWGVTSTGDVLVRRDKQFVQISGITPFIAVDIAIGVNGIVIVSDDKERLYQYDESRDRFNRLLSPSGKLSPRGERVAVDADGNPWTVRESGQVIRCDKDPCELVPGQRGRDISIGPDGSIFLVDSNNALRRFDENTSEFNERVITASNAVSVGPKGRPWIIRNTDQIFASAFFDRDESNDLQDIVMARNEDSPSTATQNNNDSESSFVFTKNLNMQTISVVASGVTLPVQDISISPTGRVLAVDNNGNFIEYNESARVFDKIIQISSPAIVRFQIALDGTIWGFDASDKFYRLVNNNFQEFPTQSSGGSEVPYVAVSADGSVFLSNEDATLLKFNEGQNRFVRFPVTAPGKPRVHGVEPDGDPWVIDDDTFRLYAFENSQFVLKRENVGFFNIGGNGTLYLIEEIDGVSTSPFLVFKYNATNDSFDRTNQTTEGVEVGHDGRLWLLQNSGEIQRAR